MSSKDACLKRGEYFAHMAPWCQVYTESASSRGYMKIFASFSRIESGSGGDSEVQRTMLELLNQVSLLLN
jgi:hypothetical protein